MQNQGQSIGKLQHVKGGGVAAPIVVRRVTWVTDPITPANHTAAAFVMENFPVGTPYTFEIERV